MSALPKSGKSAPVLPALEKPVNPGVALFHYALSLCVFFMCRHTDLYARQEIWEKKLGLVKGEHQFAKSLLVCRTVRRSMENLMSKFRITRKNSFHVFQM